MYCFVRRFSEILIYYNKIKNDSLLGSELNKFIAPQQLKNKSYRNEGKKYLFLQRANKMISKICYQQMNAEQEQFLILFFYLKLNGEVTNLNSMFSYVQLLGLKRKSAIKKSSET